MFWLALAGLAVSVAGIATRTVAAYKQAEHDAGAAEVAAERLYNPSEEIDSAAEFYDEQAGLYEDQATLAQEAATTRAAQMETQGELALSESRIQAAGIASRALDVGEQSAQARGAIAAAAGAGNVGGGSVLRQSMRAQRMANRQATQLSAQGAAVRERGLFAFRSARENAALTRRQGQQQYNQLMYQSAYSGWQGDVARGQAQDLLDEADWLRDMGLLTAIGGGLQAAGTVIDFASEWAPWGDENA